MTEWQPIETAPQDEIASFLIRTHEYGGAKPVVIQVSRFDGRLYPDAFGAAIDWDDAVTDATHWQPLPEPPK